MEKCFFVPAILAVIMTITLWFLIRDTPIRQALVELPELATGENYTRAKDKKEESAEYKAFIKKQVFRNLMFG
jgi:sugar phosphate permease